MTRKEVDADSSSADEGPEEPRGVKSVAQKRQASRARGRQSSVHDLVHQYGGAVGGAVVKEKEKERERSSVQYNVVGDYKPQKARLAPPSTTLDADRKTPSPTMNMTKSTSTAPDRSPLLQPQAINDKPQPPITADKPLTSRSRPQSMFIFPSKSTDGSFIPSTNLMPPQEPKPRAVRRTSISDMVQRYEAIGGTMKSAGAIAPGPPSPIHRPVSTKSTSASVENGRVQKGFPEQVKPITPQASMPSDLSGRSGGDPLKPRITSYEPVRQSTTGAGASRTPPKVLRKMTTSRGPSPSPEKRTPQPRRISMKAEPSATFSHGRSETTAKVSHSSESSFRPPNSPRKPPISMEEDSSSKREDRSTSPERPYQGVGRLIDQWQKKSAEAATPRPPPPGKLIPKRAGIVREDR